MERRVRLQHDTAIRCLFSGHTPERAHRVCVNQSFAIGYLQYSRAALQEPKNSVMQGTGRRAGQSLATSSTGVAPLPAIVLASACCPQISHLDTQQTASCSQSPCVRIARHLPIRRRLVPQAAFEWSPRVPFCARNSAFAEGKGSCVRALPMIALTRESRMVPKPFMPSPAASKPGF